MHFSIKVYNNIDNRLNNKIDSFQLYCLYIFKKNKKLMN